MQCLSEENAIVLAYWISKAGTRAMPARGDLDPVPDLRELSQYLFLVDVRDDGQAFHFRLVGSGLVDYLGADVTGKSLDELAKGEQPFAEFKEQFSEAISARATVRGVFHIPSQFTFHKMPFERLILPLSDDGRTVNMLLGTVNLPSEDMPEDHSEVVLLKGTESGAGDDNSAAQPQERRAINQC